ncbi:MAG: ATP-binding protein [Treponema sp.]|jgi:predicted AAA+ superfamily ATPase|nr:ATP-binding protein [Treponema sp.]
MNDVQAGLADLAGLTIFADCGETPLLGAFRFLLEEWALVSPEAPEALGRNRPGPPAGGKPPLSLLRCWAALVREIVRGPGAPDAESDHPGASNLGAPETSFFSRVRDLALSSDNPFTLAVERGAAGPLLTRLAGGDLERLGRIAAFDISALGFAIALYLRSWGLEAAASGVEAEARSLWQAEGRGDAAVAAASLKTEGPVQKPEGRPPQVLWSPEDFAAHIRRSGAGILSGQGFFRWESGPQPVFNSDPIRLADLSGYKDQRSLVINNTLAFLEGKSANNLLLYGDRGTGKSATIKAVCREYRGLRLLELRQEAMAELPAVMAFTATRGLRFVIFIDDLSFEGIDDSFTGLKALLEGGVETRPPNTVIYATSNRRHLVKELAADRGPGPELRSFDTMQEQLSLADRFGLTVFFTAPSQEEYLDIAGFIAEKRGLSRDGCFRENALRWEKWFNGRSPRTAAQFVDWMAGGRAFPWE